MKKRLVTLLVSAMALLLVACGGEEKIILKDMDVEKLVVPGEYKGIEVKVESASSPK